MGRVGLVGLGVGWCGWFRRGRWLRGHRWGAVSAAGQGGGRGGGGGCTTAPGSRARSIRGGASSRCGGRRTRRSCGRSRGSGSRRLAGGGPEQISRHGAGRWTVGQDRIAGAQHPMDHAVTQQRIGGRRAETGVFAGPGQRRRPARVSASVNISTWGRWRGVPGWSWLALKNAQTSTSASAERREWYGHRPCRPSSTRVRIACSNCTAPAVSNTNLPTSPSWSQRYATHDQVRSALATRPAPRHADATPRQPVRCQPPTTRRRSPPPRPVGRHYRLHRWGTRHFNAVI